MAYRHRPWGLRVTAREPEPIDPVRCPWCTRTDCTEPATDHERDRTGCRWWSTCRRALFHGTATEYARIRAEVYAAEAEAMTTRPKEQP